MQHALRKLQKVLPIAGKVMRLFDILARVRLKLLARATVRDGREILAVPADSQISGLPRLEARWCRSTRMKPRAAD